VLKFWGKGGEVTMEKAEGRNQLMVKKDKMNRREAIKRISRAAVMTGIAVVSPTIIGCAGGGGGYRDSGGGYSSYSSRGYSSRSTIYGSYSSFTYYSHTFYRSQATYSAYSSSNYTPYSSYYLSQS